jgi:hypothetical protein
LQVSAWLSLARLNTREGYIEIGFVLLADLSQSNEIEALLYVNRRKNNPIITAIRISLNTLS